MVLRARPGVPSTLKWWAALLSLPGEDKGEWGGDPTCSSKLVVVGVGPLRQARSGNRQQEILKLCFIGESVNNRILKRWQCFFSLSTYSKESQGRAIWFSLIPSCFSGLSSHFPKGCSTFSSNSLLCDTDTDAPGIQMRLGGKLFGWN